MPHRWDRTARLRADQIEKGLDLTFSQVFVPYYSELLSGLGPDSVLEVGGGTGHLGRELASLSKRYVMVEPSEGMHSVALRTIAGTDIELHNEPIEQFAARNRQFECVLCHMCIQVVAELPTFLHAISSVLSSGGCFVAALPHPAFYNDYKNFFSQDTFRYTEERSATISFSISLDPDRRIDGIPYHHRPIGTYVSALRAARLGIDAFDEIFPAPDVQMRYGAPWSSPRYLVIRGKHWL
jgi:SAM-dependent methyltransferase